jgi:hypothetical protein
VHEFWGRYVIHLLTPALPKYAVLVIAVAVTVALASAIHRLVERPFAGRLRRNVLRTLQDGQRPTAPEAAVTAVSPAGGHPSTRPDDSGTPDRHGTATTARIPLSARVATGSRASSLVRS